VKVVWIDTETTGLGPDDVAVEVAALLEVDGEVVDTFHTLLRPLDPELVARAAFDAAAAVTGITRERLLADGVPQTEAMLAFRGWLGRHIDKFNTADKAWFAGYNARFDMDVLRRVWPDKWFGSWFWSHPLDVLQAAVAEAVIFGQRPPSFKLADVCAHHGIAEAEWHGALADIKATRALWHELCAHRPPAPGAADPAEEA